MADLTNFKLSAKERLARAEKIPLPSQSGTSIGAFRSNAKPEAAVPSPADDTVKPEAEAPAPADDLNLINDSEQIDQPVHIPSPEAGKDTKGSPNPEALGDEPTLTFRPLLQFSLSMLPKAEAVARELNVSVEMLAHKVALETVVVNTDFSSVEADPRARRKPYRGAIHVPKMQAERFLSEVDPLGLRERGRVLRPVYLRAFDRAARIVLADLEREVGKLG